MYVSFEYDRSYFPPFPVLEITIIGGTTQQIVTGLIDSGSDATQVPLHILQMVGARDVDDRWVRDYYGIRRPATIYAVQLQIGSLVLYGMEVIGRERTDEVLVGRDVLNQLIVTLNGLAHVTQISD